MTTSVLSAERPTSQPARPRRVRRRNRMKTKEALAAYLLLIPWLIGIVFFVGIPMIMSFGLSLTDFNFLSPPEFTGLENYQKLVGDERYLQSLRVTGIYVFVSVPLQLAFALGLAMLLNRGMRGLAFYRGAFYLPSLIGGSVAIAILWRNIFGAQGLVNGPLSALGIETRSWVSDPSTALITLVVLNVWTFGSPMIIFLAGLRQIPEVYYEAASIDGAGKVRQFISITLPLLSPIVFFNLVLQMINAFQAFTPASIVSGGTGGPNDATLFYTLYLYLEGFTKLRMGYASAMAWILVLIIGVFTLINFLTSRLWVHYESD